MARTPHRSPLLGLVIAALLLLLAAQPARAANIGTDVDANTHKQVSALLAELARAYMAKDVDALMALSAPDPVLNIGTGKDEWLTSRAELEASYRRDFTQASQTKVAFNATSMARRGDVVWVAGRAPVTAVTDSGPVSFEARFTCVLIKVKGAWRIAQSHMSVPSDAQPEGTSYPGNVAKQ